MGRLLVYIGLTVTAIGLLMMVGIPIGGLPGDISFRRGHVTFYFPIVTCLVLSLILTIILSLVRR